MHQDLSVREGGMECWGEEGVEDGVGERMEQAIKRQRKDSEQWKRHE